MSEPKTLIYKGEVYPPLNDKKFSPYLPAPELVEAVNLTIALKKRPLLLKGEPGTGKTCLAQAVAYELGLKYYEEWHVKSTSKARDGFYFYDALHRLHDAQTASTKEDRDKAKDISNYIHPREMWRAFKNPERTVVLIDEIDKADIDFPNDLLLALDQQRFKIDELNTEIEAKEPPIIFITSNNERELPDAFLRRCLFHYIQFPSDSQLLEIVKIHFPKSSVPFIEAIVERFIKLREDMVKEKGNTGKKVSTSELLDWVDVLRHQPEDKVINQLKTGLPFPQVLLKSREDHQRFIKNATDGQ